MPAILHAVLFATGVVALLLGIALELPALLVVAGPCLAASGLLIWIGVRITLHGPLGDVLRLALGRGRALTLHLRALLWFAIGVAVTVLGVRALRDGGAAPPWRPEPLAPSSMRDGTCEEGPFAAERGANALAAFVER